MAAQSDAVVTSAVFPKGFILCYLNRTITKEALMDHLVVGFVLSFNGKLTFFLKRDSLRGVYAVFWRWDESYFCPGNKFRLLNIDCRIGVEISSFNLSLSEHFHVRLSFKTHAIICQNMWFWIKTHAIFIQNACVNVALMTSICAITFEPPSKMSILFLSLADNFYNFSTLKNVTQTHSKKTWKSFSLTHLEIIFSPPTHRKNRQQNLD